MPVPFTREDLYEAQDALRLFNRTRDTFLEADTAYVEGPTEEAWARYQMTEQHMNAIFLVVCSYAQRLYEMHEHNLTHDGPQEGEVWVLLQQIRRQTDEHRSFYPEVETPWV